MTLPYSPSKAIFNGNGVATDFPFSFKVWNTSQLDVTISDPEGVASTASGWSATLQTSGGDGGTVSYQKDGKPLPAGWTLAIVRNMKFSQEVDLINNTMFHAEVVEDQLDYATAERQQLKEAVDRSIKVPPTNPNPPELLADMLFEARDETLAAAAAASLSETAAAASAEAAAVSEASAALILETATTVIGESETAALDSIEAKRVSVMAEVIAEHADALNDIATDKADAVGAIAADKADAVEAIATDRATALSDIAGSRSESMGAISGLATERLTAITREGQLQQNAVAAAGAGIVASGKDVINQVVAEGDIQEGRVNATGTKARVDLVLEGDAQVNRVTAVGAEYVLKTYDEAERATGQAEIAKEAAERAVNLTGQGYATKTGPGIMQVGDGLKVDDKGRVSTERQTIVVSNPALTFPADVALGYEYTLTMSATSLPGIAMSYFEVVFDGAAQVGVVANAEGQGTLKVIPKGVDLASGTISVIGVDTTGNKSLATLITFIKHAVVMRAPHILSPLEGDTDVPLLAQIQVQSFDIYGMASTGIATQLQIFSDESLTTLVYDSGENHAYATSFSMLERLPDGRGLWSRARHKAEVYGWSEFGAVVSFSTIAKRVAKPRIIAPISGAVDQPVNVAVVLSPIDVKGIPATPSNTRVVVARDNALVDIVFDSGDNAAYSTSVATSGLPVNTLLYCAGQHRDGELGWSELADVSSFTTLNAYTVAPSITEPTAASDVELRPTFTFSDFSNIGPVDTLKQRVFQVASDPIFSNLIVNVTLSGANAGQYSLTADLPLFAYAYARVQDEGATWGLSAWSAVYAFKTLDAYTNKPSITSPAQGAIDIGVRPTFTASAFSNAGPVDTPDTCHWQLSGNEDFTNNVEEYSGAYKNTFTPAADLAITKDYWVRVKYRGKIWRESEWSDAVKFTTLNAYTETPSITSPTAEWDVDLRPTFTFSEFRNVGPADTLKQRVFQLASDPLFSNLLVNVTLSGANAGQYSLTADLPIMSQFFARVQDEGTTWGPSAWSTVYKFYTLNAYVDMPEILSPKNGATGVELRPKIVLSAFGNEGPPDTHSGTKFIITRKGTNTVLAQYDGPALTEWTPPEDLPLTTEVRVNAKFIGTKWGEGDWGPGASFTTLTAFISAPTVTGLTEGQTGVLLQPSVTVGAFSVTPVGFDTPKGTDNFAYRFEKADGTLLEAGLRTLPAAGGMIQPTNNLPLDSDCIFRGHWLGNTLIGPDVVIRFKTLQYTVPLGQTWLIRESGTWVNPVPGGTYAIYAMGGGGGGAVANPGVAGGGGGSGYATYQQKPISGNVNITVGQGGGGAVDVFQGQTGTPTTLQEIGISVVGGQGGRVTGESARWTLVGGHGGNGGGGGSSYNTQSHTSNGGNASGSTGGYGFWVDDDTWGTYYSGNGGNGAGTVAGLPAPQGGLGGVLSTVSGGFKIPGGQGGSGYGGGGGGGSTHSSRMGDPIVIGGKGGSGLTVEGVYLGGKGGDGGAYDSGFDSNTAPTAGEKGGVLIKLIAYPA